MRIVPYLSILPLLFLVGCGTPPAKSCPPPAALDPLCNTIAAYPEAFAAELADQVAGLPAGSPAARAMNDYLLLRDMTVVLCTARALATAPAPSMALDAPISDDADAPMPMPMPMPTGTEPSLVPVEEPPVGEEPHD